MAKALLVVGIHREERAFGEAVASQLDSHYFDTLCIPNGLSGVRPLNDQRFRFKLLHQALYRQLLPYVQGCYPILIDLHTGINDTGLCIDFFSPHITLVQNLVEQALPAHEIPVRCIRMVTAKPGNNPTTHLQAETVIPETVWQNPDFLYLGVEVFLAQAGAGSIQEQHSTRCILQHLTPALLATSPNLLPIRFND